MSPYQFTSLSISGHGDEPLPNTLLRQSDKANALAVVLPGLRYSAELPLLYYPTKLLLQRGADVLRLNADYTRTGFQSATQQKQLDWLVADARAAIQAGRSQRDTSRLILIGKSIGTLTLAQLVYEGLESATILIWLTPLLRHPRLVEAAASYTGPSFFVIGSGDPTYDPKALAEVRKAPRAQTLVIENADHSMEIPGDIFASLNVMSEILRGTANFLDRLPAG